MCEPTAIVRGTCDYIKQPNSLTPKPQTQWNDPGLMQQKNSCQQCCLPASRRHKRSNFFIRRLAWWVTSLESSLYHVMSGMTEPLDESRAFLLWNLKIDSLIIRWHDDKIRYLFFQVSPWLNYLPDTWRLEFLTRLSTGLCLPFA